MKYLLIASASGRLLSESELVLIKALELIGGGGGQLSERLGKKPDLRRAALQRHDSFIWLPAATIKSYFIKAFSATQTEKGKARRSR